MVGNLMFPLLAVANVVFLLSFLAASLVEINIISI